MCLINFSAQYANGSPASFASVSVYEVRGFLWWQFEVWVASSTLSFTGKTTFNIAQGKAHHFKVYTPASTGNYWRTPSYCPYPISVVLPK